MKLLIWRMLPIIAFSFIGCSETESLNRHLEDTILQHVSSVLDKNKLERVDCVRIMRIDSLTERSMLFVYMDDAKDFTEECERNVEYYRNRSKSHLENIVFNNRYGLDNSFDTKWRLKDSLSAVEYEQLSEEWKQRTDSFRRELNVADGVKHWGYKVTANVFYAIEGNVDTIKYVNIIDKAFNVADTSNPLLSRIRLNELLDSLKGSKL